MRSLCTVLPLVALVAAVLVLWLPGDASSQGVPASRLAFVDVARVFKEYKRASDVQQETRVEIQKVELQLRERYEKLKKMRDDLDLLVPDTKEFNEQKRALDFEAFQLEYEEKQQKQAILANAVTKMNRVYTEIRREAENFALRNNLEAVFMMNDQEIDARSLEELQVLIASRPVLYREKARDVTDSILSVLNK
ncbi:MAG: OmpH family outer membrane protein [Planctomycetes bacterium]|jgi:Skp family chaperone for outer membrane proteins|nr:OmpH family outer membrane protein [Planctomycetota bacterium]